ncbi:amidase [Calothrix sp. 336/3]|uniref:amidase n=1 Tax=Calothrix sp. 336/3 TaxID=1337936 RepID=UPI0004E3CEC0|nr:amidase [Calothrix sp. 336/3]AKG20472.1 amidase [Calothrix sp. 336/3]
MNEIVFKSAVELAQMISDRQVSAMEVLEAHLAQIARYNSKLNAICTLDEANARIKAKQADEALAKGENWGALHGVPVTIKDIFETAGLRTTAGYIPLKDYIPQEDATVVGRLKAAGAIILGKTNMAELAADYQSINSLFPSVNNPWHLDYTPGGSSGGSAAAIAAGLSPLDLGNDFGGSIRQPAHFCGVYGLKPTDRRLSTAGIIPEVPGMPLSIRQMMTVGCFARSLADIRLGFSLMVGADIRRPDVPPVPLDTPSGKSIKDLKIAWSDEWADIPVATDIRNAMHNMAQKLAESGVQLEPWQPQNFDIAKIMNLYMRVAAYNTTYAQPQDRYTLKLNLALIARSATQGDKKLRQLGDFSRFLPEILNPSLKRYFEALTERDRFIGQLDLELEPWDVWLVPVAATSAFTHRPAWSAVEIDGRSYPYGVANGGYSMPFNLSGHPAIVIPIGQTQEGLPIGMQIVGKRWREMELIAIAQQLDQIIGTFQHPPLF